uniref:BAG family molecular chaperone regulator 5 n=1 Tax=Eptatretus burgeri TaxID=7764 RepID=A0A8C4WZA2_EPTBU
MNNIRRLNGRKTLRCVYHSRQSANHIEFNENLNCIYLFVLNRFIIRRKTSVMISNLFSRTSALCRAWYMVILLLIISFTTPYSVQAEVEPMKQELLLSLASDCPEVSHYTRLAKALNAVQLRLDAVEACGRETIRAYRRASVQRVSLLLRFLDHAGEMGIGFVPSVEENVGGVGNLLDTAPLTLSGLQRQLLALQGRLDAVQTGRNPYVRQERRRAVLEVQALLSHGDLLHALEEWKIKTGSENEDVQPAHPAEVIVLQQLCGLQRQVLSFSGRHGDKDYLFLEELLTTQLLALDAVETHGDRSARDVRRSAVTTAQGMLSYLDLKSDDIDD